MAFFRFLTRGGGAVGFFRPQEPKSSNNVSTSSLSAQGSPAFSSARSASRRPRTGMSVMVSGRRSPAANTATQPSYSRRMNSASSAVLGPDEARSPAPRPRRGRLCRRSRRRRRRGGQGQCAGARQFHPQLHYMASFQAIIPPARGKNTSRRRRRGENSPGNFKVYLLSFRRGMI